VRRIGTPPRGKKVSGSMREQRRDYLKSGNSSGPKALGGKKTGAIFLGEPIEKRLEEELSQRPLLEKTMRCGPEIRQLRGLVNVELTAQKIASKSKA